MQLELDRELLDFGDGAIKLTQPRQRVIAVGLAWAPAQTLVLDPGTPYVEDGPSSQDVGRRLQVLPRPLDCWLRAQAAEPRSQDLKLSPLDLKCLDTSGELWGYDWPVPWDAINQRLTHGTGVRDEFRIHALQTASPDSSWAMR